jgi:hypothetical protein
MVILEVSKMWIGLKNILPVDTSVDQASGFFPQGEMILFMGPDPTSSLRRASSSHI